MESALHQNLKVSLQHLSQRFEVPLTLQAYHSFTDMMAANHR